MTGFWKQFGLGETVRGGRVIFQVISPASNAMLTLVLVLICLCVAVSALIFGRPVERAGGWFLTISMGLHILFESIFPDFIGSTGPIELIVSFVDLAMFSTLALRTYRLWPIIAGGSLVLISTVKSIEWYGANIGGFGNDRILAVIWLSVPLLLFASLIRSKLRQRLARVQKIRRK